MAGGRKEIKTHYQFKLIRTQLHYKLGINTHDTIKISANTLWKSVSRGSKIDADLQRYQLQITTRSSMGSNEGIFLVFYDDEGLLAGGAVIYFFLSRHVDYMIPYCGDDFVSVYATIPANQDTVWSIHRTAYGLKIEYNGRVLVDYHTSVWCKSYWERRVTKFEFHYSDDASKTYRIISPGIFSLELQFVHALFDAWNMSNCLLSLSFILIEHNRHRVCALFFMNQELNMLAPSCNTYLTALSSYISLQINGDIPKSHKNNGGVPK